MTELFSATGLVSMIALVFNVLVSFRSGKPLVEWINPGRHFLPALTFTMLLTAGGLFWRASLKHHQSEMELLRTLLTRDTAPYEVVGAVAFTIFGLGLLPLFGWCWWYLPRSPQTFSSNARDFTAGYKAALRHYVRWPGGLDYAALFAIRDQTLVLVAEGADDRAILCGLERMAGIPSSAKESTRTVGEQKAAWGALAQALFKSWTDLDRHVALARQGRSVGVSFNTWCGAVFIETISYVQPAGDEPPVGVVLFAACLNQHEVNTFKAPEHFSLLSQAIRHIRSGMTRT